MYSYSERMYRRPGPNNENMIDLYKQEICFFNNESFNKDEKFFIDKIILMIYIMSKDKFNIPKELLIKFMDISINTIITKCSYINCSHKYYCEEIFKRPSYFTLYEPVKNVCHKLDSNIIWNIKFTPPERVGYLTTSFHLCNDCLSNKNYITCNICKKIKIIDYNIDSKIQKLTKEGVIADKKKYIFYHNEDDYIFEMTCHKCFEKNWRNT